MYGLFNLVYSQKRVHGILKPRGFESYPTAVEEAECTERKMMKTTQRRIFSLTFISGLSRTVNVCTPLDTNDGYDQSTPDHVGLFGRVLTTDRCRQSDHGISPVGTTVRKGSSRKDGGPKSSEGRGGVRVSSISSVGIPIGTRSAPHWCRIQACPKIWVPSSRFYLCGTNETPGLVAATGASVLSAPFINPIRMIEKQQRAAFKQTHASKSVREILRESAAKNYRPLFRGTIPLMGHSFGSATMGLVGQPQLEQYIKHRLGGSENHQLLRGLVASAVVSPMYVILTNPLSRMEVILQTASIQGKSVHVLDACKEILNDSKQFGVRGLFRGQGIGIAKAIVSLTVFHQGRLGLVDVFKRSNEQTC